MTNRTIIILTTIFVVCTRSVLSAKLAFTHFWCVVLVIFHSRCKIKSRGAIFFSILCSHKCRNIYTRFHAFHASMLSSTMVFYVMEKTCESSIFYNSCGTLIWVRIIPVKVESGLSGITRPYIIVTAHLRSLPSDDPLSKGQPRSI